MASRANGRRGDALAHAGREGAQRDDRLLLQLGDAGERDVPVEEVDAPAEVDRRRRLLAAALRAKPLEEARPGARDGARAQVERLHQALGGEGSVVAVSHRHRQRLLVLEAEAIGLPARAQVQSVAHAPEELLGLGDLVRLARHHDAHLDEAAPGPARGSHAPLGLLADAVAGPRRPADAVEVAKPAGAALHVGLEQVHRAAEALVPRGGLGLEPVDERAEVARRRRGPRSRGRSACGGGLRRRRASAGRAAPSRSPGTSRASGSDLAGAQDLVADGQPRVPQRIEERLDERARLLRADDLRVDDEDDVGVAVEGDGAAPEAPDGGQRDPARQTRLAQRVLEEELEARVEEPRVRAAESDAVFPALEPRDEARSMSLERVAERHRLERRRAECCETCGVIIFGHVRRRGM